MAFNAGSKEDREENILLHVDPLFWSSSGRRKNSWEFTPTISARIVIVIWSPMWILYF